MTVPVLAYPVFTLDNEQLLPAGTRLTPDVLFPESESPVFQWHAPVGVVKQPPVPLEEKRWPGHCYRSPYPLSTNIFLAAYSYDALIGEPDANPANMFGLYLLDGFGNKELIYRDLNICSLWPAPLRPRPRPPVIPHSLEKAGTQPAGKKAAGESTMRPLGTYQPPSVTSGRISTPKSLPAPKSSRRKAVSIRIRA